VNVCLTFTASLLFHSSTVYNLFTSIGYGLISSIDLSWLKEQSHDKVCEMITLNDGLSPNYFLTFKKTVGEPYSLDQN
jgi:hypothetical protein